MDRQKNMHHNNQNRQNSSTGAVPKPRSNREAPREVVARVVAPIVRERPQHNVASNNLLLDWQYLPIDQQYSPSDHGQRFSSRDSRPPSEGGGFEQVVNGISPSHDQGWLPVVRPQIRKRNQPQSISMSGTNIGPQHASPNTAIVMPTTPNMIHPLTNGDNHAMNMHNDMYSSQRASQVLPTTNRAQADERRNHEYSSNVVQSNDQIIDQSNDLNSSLNGISGTEIGDDNMKRRHLEMKVDISNRKLQVLQNQHTQLLRIQESAKVELEKLRKHKLLEQQKLEQQHTNQTNKVYSVQSTQQNDNLSVSGDNNTTTMQMQNQTDFSFQPVNPMMYSLQNNCENINNDQQRFHDNGGYNSHQDSRSREQNYSIVTNGQCNGSFSVNSDEVTSDNNVVTSDINLNAGNFNQVDDNLSNISKRLFAVDAIMETRAELEALSNSAFMSAQNDYDDKLRELQNKKKQMDSLVADLQQLNSQAARANEQRRLDNIVTDDNSEPQQTQSEHENEHNISEPERPESQRPVANAPGSGVGEEIAQITAMKMQLTRLKEMMDTMKYIEAHTGCSPDSARSSSHESSVSERHSPSTVETLNYPESWASSTMKPNNVDNVCQVPYKVLLSDNENLNSVSNWLDSDGDRPGKYPEAPASEISVGGISLETVQSLSQDLREQANALNAERERLVAAQSQITSRPDRSTSMSSSYSNRPEKRVNQASQNQQQKSAHSSSQELGPKERQQQLLKAQLEAKKRELEELMKKDRDLSSRINQDASTSSGAVKEAAHVEVDGQTWFNDQSSHNNSNFRTPTTTTRKSSTQSLSASEAGARRIESQNNRPERQDSQSTIVTSLHESMNNDTNNQQQSNVPRNSSRQTNVATPPIPPPMPDLNWRKGSQDSGNYATTGAQINYRPYELNSATQNQIWWQQRIAQQIQAQLEIYMHQYQNASLAAAAAAANQSAAANQQNPAVLPAQFYGQQPVGAGFVLPAQANANATLSFCNASHLAAPPLPPPPPPPQYCGCNSALWQMMWLQQREIANIGSAVCTLQERMLQLTMQPNNLFNNTTQIHRTLPTVSDNPSASAQQYQQTPVESIQQSPAKILTQNRASQSNSSICPNLSSSNTPSQSTVILLPQDTDSIISHSSLNSGNNFDGNQNFENPQYVHNNTTNPQNFCQNMMLGVSNEFGATSNTQNSTTLNNQVAPGNRANNYWDNFRSYSRQNLLSGNYKSKELALNQCPSPLMQRSHNSLRSATSMCQLPTPKTNAQTLPEINNQIIDQGNNVLPTTGQQIRLQSNVRNVQEIQPDVLNINPNVNPTAPSPVTQNNDNQQEAAINNTSGVWGSPANCPLTNYPEIVQSHSSFSDVSQQNLKANLPLKSTGANKKRSRIATSNNECEDLQQNSASSSMSSEARHDLNLLLRGNTEQQAKSTSKPFDQLRDAVYGEVTALIAQNESRPQYLLQLFRDLRQVGCDPLRQRALHGIRDLVAAGPSVQPSENVVHNSRPVTMATSNIMESEMISLADETHSASESRGQTFTPRLAEAQTSAENSEQRCSSTSDASFSEQALNIHEDGASSIVITQSSGPILNNDEAASAIDVSCSEASCSSYAASSMVRNSELPKCSLSKCLSDSSVSSPRNEDDNPDMYSVLANYVLSNSGSSRMEEENIADAEAWGVDQRHYGNAQGSMASGSDRCLENEDLAEADQVRGSAPCDELPAPLTGAQSNSPRNPRQVPAENEARTGDGSASLFENDAGHFQNEPAPLPDLARVGPGGDPDAAEAIRSVSTTGLEHGLDRVPTRLSNGPWSPQSSTNDNINDASSQNGLT